MDLKQRPATKAIVHRPKFLMALPRHAHDGSILFFPPRARKRRGGSFADGNQFSPSNFLHFRQGDASFTLLRSSAPNASKGRTEGGGAAYTSVFQIDLLNVHVIYREFAVAHH